MSPAEIRSARESLGLTASELAVQLGVTARTVYRWEDGSREMPAPTERLLANLCAGAVAALTAA